MLAAAPALKPAVALKATTTTATTATAAKATVPATIAGSTWTRTDVGAAAAAAGGKPLSGPPAAPANGGVCPGGKTPARCATDPCAAALKAAGGLASAVCRDAAMPVCVPDACSTAGLCLVSCVAAPPAKLTLADGTVLLPEPGTAGTTSAGAGASGASGAPSPSALEPVAAVAAPAAGAAAAATDDAPPKSGGGGNKAKRARVFNPRYEGTCRGAVCGRRVPGAARGRTRCAVDVNGLTVGCVAPSDVASPGRARKGARMSAAGCARGHARDPFSGACARCPAGTAPEPGGVCVETTEGAARRASERRAAGGRRAGP